MSASAGSPVGRAARGGPGVRPGDVLANAPCPVLVARPSGVISQVNGAAARLFPEAAPGALLEDTTPAWLAVGHRRLAATAPAGGTARSVRGRVAGRCFEARPTPGEGGRIVWWLIDDTPGTRSVDRSGELGAALHEDQERTTFLVSATTALLTTLNADRCTELGARLASGHLADGAVVLAPRAGGDFALAYGIAGAPAGHDTVDEAAVTGVPVLREALHGFPPVIPHRVLPARLPAWAVPPGLDRDVGSAWVVPLPGHGLPAGALVLLHSRPDRVPTRRDELFVRLFATRAGAALAAARIYARQSAITETLMRELLPPRLHPVHGVDFAGGYRASGRAERVGGDFYDVHPGAGPDDESLAVLGDVCGKGLEAAVLTGKIRHTLQALLPLGGHHQRVLGMLNRTLLVDDGFATLVLASAVRHGDTVHLRLTSAGHPPPLVLRADGRVSEVPSHGTLVGVLDEIEAETVRVRLAPGETCLLYSDGITEARGGPMGRAFFGEERLAAALAECARMPAEAVVAHVGMLATQWVGEGRHDDMALLAVTAPCEAPAARTAPVGPGDAYRLRTGRRAP